MDSKNLENVLEKLSTCPSVLVVGDVGVDKYTFGVVERISPEAPVPVLEVTKQWHKLGLAANVSDNLIGLGVESTLSGVIGEDSYGNLLEELLEEQGLKTWGIIRTANRPTTLKERVTTQSQQLCRIDYESFNPIDEETQDKLVARADQFVADHGAVILQDYGKGLLSSELCQIFIKKFKDKNKQIIVDPSRYSDPFCYKGSSLLKPNFKEAQIMGEILGVDELFNVELLIKTISEKLEIPQVLITLGKDGMAIFDANVSDKIEIIPTFANEVFDVSGAGDTVVSVVVACLLTGHDLKTAAEVGNLAAGVVVGKKGTARVSKEELLRFHKQHIN